LAFIVQQQASTEALLSLPRSPTGGQRALKPNFKLRFRFFFLRHSLDYGQFSATTLLQRISLCLFRLYSYVGLLAMRQKNPANGGATAETNNVLARLIDIVWINHHTALV